MPWRRRKLPASLRPRLEPEERVVAWAPTAAGGAAIATNRGLFLPGREQRLGWHEIHKASWTGRELTVVPAALVEEREGYTVTADAPALSVTIPERSEELPKVVRARVTRSVAFSSHHPLPGGGVLVVARRVPGVDGVSWAVRYDDGTDPDAPHVVAATDQLVSTHRDAL